MLKIIRLFNKNRRKIWIGLIIAIFCIAIISILNKGSQKQAQNDMKKLQQEIIEQGKQENPSEIVDYEKASSPLATGEKIQTSVRDEVQGALEQFIKAVCNGNIQEAYSYLTLQCKELKYPSVESFQQSYCEDIQGKIYDFQLWSSENNVYTYQIKYMDNLLASGKDNSKNYIQDYITVMSQNGVYKLNINKLIKVENVKREEETHNIQFLLKRIETYLDYQYYEFEITNNNENEVIIDTQKDEKSVYVKNVDNLKIRALLYENLDEDLIIAPKQSKNIKIKFNNTYNEKKFIVSVGFSDIIYNQELYKEDEKKEAGKTNLEIYLK